MPDVRISRALSCDVGIVAARVRLLKLLHLGYLHHACVTAFESGAAALPDPAPDSHQPPTLEMVSIAEPEPGHGTVRLPVRWQARWAGRSLRILDAELTLTASRGATGVRLDGSFPLPLPPASSPAVASLAQLGAAAAACAESLLRQLADALTRFDGPGDGQQPRWHWIRPGTPTPPRSLPAGQRAPGPGRCPCQGQSGVCLGGGQRALLVGQALRPRCRHVPKQDPAMRSLTLTPTGIARISSCT